MTKEDFIQSLTACEWMRHVEFHTVTGEHASNPDTCSFCHALVPTSLEFDRINHGPFEHPVSDTCAECSGNATHEFYGSDGTLQKAELIATNSVKSWTKRLCNKCWTDFQNRAFVTIDRQGNTFTATCAF